jgi:septum formation protein
LATLRAAGLKPEVLVSDVDEDVIAAPTTSLLTLALAQAKGEAVLAALSAPSLSSHSGSTVWSGARATEPTIVIACDTMLEMDGRSYGKPGTTEIALERLSTMSRSVGQLHTGHFVAYLPSGVAEMSDVRSFLRVATTTVRFAQLSEADIAWYAATGEPLNVAGSFTIDGYGGPFIAGIEGDPHNVVGISLPLVRMMLLDLGVEWPQLFA